MVMNRGALNEEDYDEDETKPLLEAAVEKAAVKAREVRGMMQRGCVK